MVPVIRPLQVHCSPPPLAPPSRLSAANWDLATQNYTTMIGNTVNADQFIGGEGSMMIRGGNTVHADHWQFIGGEGSMLWMAGREVMLSSKARRHWQAGLHHAPPADFPRAHFPRFLHFNFKLTRFLPSLPLPHVQLCCSTQTRSALAGTAPATRPPRPSKARRRRTAPRELAGIGGSGTHVPAQIAFCAMNSELLNQ